jgi:hypothetical protein
MLFLRYRAIVVPCKLEIKDKERSRAQYVVSAYPFRGSCTFVLAVKLVKVESFS